MPKWMMERSRPMHPGLCGTSLSAGVPQRRAQSSRQTSATWPAFSSTERHDTGLLSCCRRVLAVVQACLSSSAEQLASATRWALELVRKGERVSVTMERGMHQMGPRHRWNKGAVGRGKYGPLLRMIDFEVAPDNVSSESATS
ncbi:hypothetical protein CBR_g790 [Chara braunii]|uniref:Uncharacterized protein n=1 Tax=Chara braunii TaxID=69332 RepID=A0A388KC64_CHABU|nr:hypothetical protein CBR_g790 [Chara braunii]|eukprot:GBG67662.1 hypothetical protein CBR_g790 [Chara braunii]